MPSYWDFLTEFFPLMVRLCARRPISRTHVVALSATELAITSGIRLSRILEISECFAWDEVTVSEAHRFCHACNFDPTCAGDRHRQRVYIRSCLMHHPGSPPPYLIRSPYWSTEFHPLINRLKSRPNSSIASISSISPRRKYAA